METAARTRLSKGPFGSRSRRRPTRPGFRSRSSPNASRPTRSRSGSVRRRSNASARRRSRAGGTSENVASVAGADEVDDGIVSKAGGGYEQLATGKVPAEAVESAVDAVALRLEKTLGASINAAD